jgi:hypothetical protein
VVSTFPLVFWPLHLHQRLILAGCDLIEPEHCACNAVRLHKQTTPTSWIRSKFVDRSLVNLIFQEIPLSVPAGRKPSPSAKTNTEQ